MPARVNPITPSCPARGRDEMRGKRARQFSVATFFVPRVPAKRAEQRIATLNMSASFLQKSGAKKIARARAGAHRGARKMRRDARAKRVFEFAEGVPEVLRAKKDCRMFVYQLRSDKDFVYFT